MLPTALVDGAEEPTSRGHSADVGHLWLFSLGAGAPW